jgi:hypothetical protein
LKFAKARGLEFTMLDVHPPHSKIQSVGEFLLHLFTITIGLLIALGLEAAVERSHHRHQRDEAEANLRQEITDNQKQLAAVHEAIASEQANLIRSIRFLEAREANKPYDITGMSLAFSIVPLRDASWRTATATGVLDYMEYDRVQNYAAAYHLQDQFAAMEQESLDSFLQLHSYLVGGADPTKMTAQEAAAAMIDVRHAYAHLDALDGISRTLGIDYKDALKSR